MVQTLDIPHEPCMDLARRQKYLEEMPEMSYDALESMIEEFARYVESILDYRACDSRLEFAYSRLFGTRGNICRICPTDEMHKLNKRMRNRWGWAETHLRDYLCSAHTLPNVIELASRVEESWADSIERYVKALASHQNDPEIADQLGILKGVDTVGMHLAQREIFELSHTLAIPLENANAVKLRVRLLSLFLTLHRCWFCRAFPAIRSYRRTFRIYDPIAYPWWFVDCRLTEKQLNWTYRRIPVVELDWRFS